MYDHRLAQIIHQEKINNAANKRRQKASGTQSPKLNLWKLIGNSFSRKSEPKAERGFEKTHGQISPEYR